MRTAGISTWNLNLQTGLRENVSGVDNFPDSRTHDQLMALVHPNYVHLLEIVYDALRSGDLKESRNVVRIKKTQSDPKYSYFELSLVAKVENGQVTKVGSAIRDVTSQALYKQSLEQSKSALNSQCRSPI